MNGFQELDAEESRRVSERLARKLSEELRPEEDPARLLDFAFRLPVYVVGNLVGVPDSALGQTAAWIRNFVPGLNPDGGAEAIERSKNAAAHLLELAASLETKPAPWPGARLSRVMGGANLHANTIGLLMQSYEATAGLIGNTLVALGRHRDAHSRVRNDPGALRAAVEETLRFDPPVQNTRRFAARDGVLAGRRQHGGHRIREGDVILVLLAAANRDPAANRAPDTFDIDRSPRRLFTFGVGPHACPGELLAVTIAEAGVASLLRAGVDPVPISQPSTFAYRSSVNTRIPIFGVSR